MLPLKNKNYKMENTCDECAICMNEVNHGKPEKTTCGHCFHPDCLKKWTEINNTCPMCRRTYPTFPFKFNNETLKEAVMEYLDDHRIAIRKYGDISGWDVSNVTDMSKMFEHHIVSRTDSFNGDLSKWDVSNVERMAYMFYGAKSFNGDLSKWDVSNVRDMDGMFQGAESFNGDLSTKEVTLEDGTTYNAWNVSNVRVMESMFSNAKKFNGDISNWNVSNVREMSRLFYNAKSFNRDLSNWNVSNINNMWEVFKNATKFDKKNAPWYFK
jgi:surface protein